jgi:transcriptional regulator with XRE-family HTH domain
VYDLRVGSSFRAVRIRRGWRQSDLAKKAKVSSWLIRKIEHGQLEGVRLGSLRRVGNALEMYASIDVRWRGSELDRLLNARHSALHESVARYFSSLPGWVFEPEVSFAIYRDWGIVDILAWHAARQALLLIELKTAVIDVQESVGTFDRKRRLARQIAAGRGWRPRVIGAWLLIADSATNRRRVAAHREMLRAAFPADGRTLRRWVREPDRDLRALSFWSEAQLTASNPKIAARQRVRTRSPEPGSVAMSAPKAGPTARLPS